MNGKVPSNTDLAMGAVKYREFSAVFGTCGG